MHIWLQGLLTGPGGPRGVRSGQPKLLLHMRALNASAMKKITPFVWPATKNARFKNNAFWGERPPEGRTTLC